MNFRVEDKAAKMEEVVATFPDAEVDRLDGVTVTFPDWWVNVRPSNTEPFLRMCLEADTAEKCDEMRDRMIAILGEPV